ncbi:MAG TPA: hypothetical protein VFY67_12020 [Pyrinomonadaceae bacterium]|nr:hypothetical protein [Pyrinomonadaceae bacterium]
MGFLCAFAPLREKYSSSIDAFGYFSCKAGRRVEGKLNNGGQEKITVTTIDFLPVRAQEEVVLVFRGEPSAAVVEVVSYRRP